MAQEKAIRGTKLLIQVGDGADPEVFSHPCLINTERSFNLQAETQDSPTYDCDEPDAVTWMQREKVSLSGDISGAGRLYLTSFAEYDAWLRSEEPKNVKISINAPAANGGGSWTGSYHLTQLQITGGDRTTFVEVSISLQSTGEVAPFVAAA